MAERWIDHELAVRKVSWLKRDTLLYNISIGCKVDEPHFVYVSHLSRFRNFMFIATQEGHKNFSAFPTFPFGLGTSIMLLR